MGKLFSYSNSLIIKRKLTIARSITSQGLKRDLTALKSRSKVAQPDAQSAFLRHIAVLACAGVSADFSSAATRRRPFPVRKPRPVPRRSNQPTFCGQPTKHEMWPIVSTWSGTGIDERERRTSAHSVLETAASRE